MGKERERQRGGREVGRKRGREKGGATDQDAVTRHLSRSTYIRHVTWPQTVTYIRQSHTSDTENVEVDIHETRHT